MTLTIDDQDQKNRQQALDTKRSFIVQAPAGSGKTELLIQRFLALLSQVKTPNEILAITFTKKAANEMRLRVIHALKQAAENVAVEHPHQQTTRSLAKQALAQDHSLNWHLLQNPNQLRIQTIDSLCSYLTAQLPLLARFGAQPQIAENPDFLYRKAVQEVLHHLDGDYDWTNAIKKLLLHVDNDFNKLHGLLINLLAKRDQWLPYIHFEQDEAALKQQLEQNLQYVINDTLIKLNNLIPASSKETWLSIARFCAANLQDKTLNANLFACRELTKFPLPSFQHLSEWRGLISLLMTKSLSWRKRFDQQIGFIALSGLKNPEEKTIHSCMREQLLEIIAIYSADANLHQLIKELCLLPPAYYDVNQWGVLQALLQVLKILSAQLHITFQQHGKIDFIENMQAALLALGSDEAPTDLALALDYQIHHLLVDEFQDTSFSQYQLLQKLTLGWQADDGRSLFIVGDPMQSIYRFRDAEVGLFIRLMRVGLPNLQLTPLKLCINFRSQQHIVNWNNDLFSRIFPQFEDIANGAVCYSPSVANANSTTQVPIQMYGFEDSSESSQAVHIVRTITNLLQHDQDKITILVRSRSHLIDIITILKQENLAYQAIDIDPLITRACIQDLFALTCALLHLGDRIAWLSILRAPWCGLTLNDLHVIATANNYATIYQSLITQTTIQKLSPDGKDRVQRILPVLNQAYADRYRINLRSWIENTWLKLGGPATLRNQTEIDDVNAYFELLTELEQAGTISIETLQEALEKVYAQSSLNNARIQLMTIHTAKGLEFDHVILPHLEKKLPYDDKSLLIWMERPLDQDRSALLLAPIHAMIDNDDPIYNYVRKQQKIKSDYEIDRLLYVATTRAKKSLHLFFNLARNAQGDYSFEPGSFLAKLWPKIKEENFSIYTEKQVNENQISDGRDKPLYRLDSCWQHPKPFSATHLTGQHLQQAGIAFANTSPQIIGTIIHLILCTISKQGLAWWSGKTSLQQQTYIKTLLIQYAIHIKDIPKGLAVIEAAINNTLVDERGKWILRTHQAAKSEFAISTVKNTKPFHLIVDRTFIDENGTRWIIDYKTTTFSRHDMENFLANEQEKYFQQMTAYAEALNLLQSHPTKIGLYFPCIPAWCEWSFS